MIRGMSLPLKNSTQPILQKIAVYRPEHKTAVLSEPKQMRANNAFLFAIFLTDNKAFVKYVYDHPPIRQDGSPYYLLDVEAHKKNWKQYEKVCIEALRSGLFSIAHVYRDPQPRAVQWDRHDPKRVQCNQLFTTIMTLCTELRIRCDVTTTPWKESSARACELEAYRVDDNCAKRQLLQELDHSYQKMAMILSGQLLTQAAPPDNVTAILALHECWKEMHDIIQKETKGKDCDVQTARLYSFNPSRWRYTLSSSSE